MPAAVGLAALAATAVGLAAGTVATARPPASPVPDRSGYLRRWSELHGGYEPDRSAVAGRWLGLVFRVARPLAARGVSADLLTGWGVLVSVAVAAVAGLGGRWPLLAVALVVLSGGLDNVDGAVAVLTHRVTRFGYVLDSVADRLSDAAYLVALWALGAPGWVCVVGGGLMGMQEYVRARAGAAGMVEIGVVTVWERPSRVVLTAVVLLGCGLLVSAAGAVATAGSWAWAGLGLVGTAQVLLVARRRLA